jgi:hypothetical protein
VTVRDIFILSFSLVTRSISYSLSGNRTHVLDGIGGVKFIYIFFFIKIDPLQVTEKSTTMPINGR